MSSVAQQNEVPPDKLNVPVTAHDAPEPISYPTAPTLYAPYPQVAAVPMQMPTLAQPAALQAPQLAQPPKGRRRKEKKQAESGSQLPEWFHGKKCDACNLQLWNRFPKSAFQEKAHRRQEHLTMCDTCLRKIGLQYCSGSGCNRYIEIEQFDTVERRTSKVSRNPTCDICYLKGHKKRLQAKLNKEAGKPNMEEAQRIQVEIQNTEELLRNTCPENKRTLEGNSTSKKDPKKPQKGKKRAISPTGKGVNDSTTKTKKRKAPASSSSAATPTKKRSESAFTPVQPNQVYMSNGGVPTAHQFVSLMYPYHGYHVESGGAAAWPPAAGSSAVQDDDGQQLVAHSTASYFADPSMQYYSVPQQYPYYSHSHIHPHHQHVVYPNADESSANLAASKDDATAASSSTAAVAMSRMASTDAVVPPTHSATADESGAVSGSGFHPDAYLVTDGVQGAVGGSGTAGTVAPAMVAEMPVPAAPYSFVPGSAYYAPPPHYVAPMYSMASWSGNTVAGGTDDHPAGHPAGASGYHATTASAGSGTTSDVIGDGRTNGLSHEGEAFVEGGSGYFAQPYPLGMQMMYSNLNSRAASPDLAHAAHPLGAHAFPAFASRVASPTGYSVTTPGYPATPGDHQPHIVQPIQPVQPKPVVPEPAPRDASSQPA